MSLENTERLYLDRQVTLARTIFAALSLVALLESRRTTAHGGPLIFLSAYLAVALGIVVAGRFASDRAFRVPLVADVAALAVLFYLTASVSAFWFLFLFVVFALATQGRQRAILAIVPLGAAAVALRAAWSQPLLWRNSSHWAALALGMLVSGFCMGFLGARERTHLERQRFLEKITALLQFDRGLNESVRQVLGELAVAFRCDAAWLAVRDDELERLFVWSVRLADKTPSNPETLPLSRSEAFLLDTLEVSLCWEQRNGGGSGFGWDRRTGQPFRAVPEPPESAAQELAAKSLMAVTIEVAGRPSGRVLLVRSGARSGKAARRRFSAGDLRWLDQIIRHIGPPLENIFLLRNLRARAVEAERSRISRDLHDGILQTLLSLNIQLDVLRQRLPRNPEAVAPELASLKRTIQEEGEELRRFVTDLRPLRVESADMRELMVGLAERFRLEYGLAVDLFIEDRSLRLPDRLCREIFQIYRESLHNVKKHANATHVVIKLGQDEAKVSLVVDDNGKGFSFSGRYSSEELDRLRLGPISIKERTRSVGGTLTVESNPGHGARLTIEIPVN
ncbi:MAG TPA: sensor histidine kinase [Candidatus Acidoferrales bacterium]|nr:sensor histidine kinase [Candidatus Acidoferrales bacterium]